ncbi:hypothetical protein Tco_0628182 [Tanacetum coccineum]|uniref:Uncharacterized protein n=1 Tax=Tanacetum coccineum TaxID=301880 RepID=A0ABQ4WPM1_9ASTR
MGGKACGAIPNGVEGLWNIKHTGEDAASGNNHGVVIGEDSKKARILELKMKLFFRITILKTHHADTSRKIRRICACTHQRPQRIKLNTPYPERLNTPYSIYGTNIIFWKISSVVPTPRNPQYAVSNSWIGRIEPTFRPP